MTRTITALHTLQNGQAVTNLGNLPGPDEWVTASQMLDMARQIHQHAIDAQRITETPMRHEMTGIAVTRTGQFFRTERQAYDAAMRYMRSRLAMLGYAPSVIKIEESSHE